MDVAVYHPYLKEKGGAEKVVLEYARRSEHDVTVFTMFYDEEATFEGFKELDVRVVAERTAPESFFQQTMDFIIGGALQRLDLEGFDALLVSDTGPGAMINYRNHDLPVIGYCHTPLRAALPEFRETYRKGFHPFLRPFYSLMVSFYNLLERRAWSYYDKVIVNSSVTEERILEKSLIGEEKISVLNPGVDIDNEGSESYGNYFFCPSRFEPYKRQELAIEAFEEADLEGFELVLAGSSADDEYLDDLREKAGENIRIEVDVPGDRWEELYANSYAVLFLAEKEDWGIVPLEAGAYEKPVIAVNEGGPKESVQDGETGFLVEADVEEIAERMRALVEDESKLREMGNKAREVSEDYSWDSFAGRLDEKVKQLVG